MLEYYLMGANNGSKICTNRINGLLTNNFDIDLAFKAKSFLDDTNSDRLNKIIVIVLKMINDEAEKVNCIVSKSNCVSCDLNDMDCFRQKCGHRICYKCYGKECPCKSIK